jgi:hypothetical protein
MVVRHGMHAVLNPSVKLAYMETHWDTGYYEHAKATIERVVRLVLFFCCMCIASGVADSSLSSFQYDSYCTPPSSSGLAAGATPASTAQTDDAAFHDASIMIWMESAVQERMQAEAALGGPRQELHDYLNSPLVNSHGRPLDLVAWWGVSHVAIALAFADANSLPPSRNTPPAIQPSPV